MRACARWNAPAAGKVLTSCAVRLAGWARPRPELSRSCALLCRLPRRKTRPYRRALRQRRISVVLESTRAQKPGSLLDIGCGDGSFLLAAQNNGWQVQGTEFNPQPARQKGLVVVTDISEIPTTAQFDCITLWHSLEHLSDPVNTLRSLRSRLSPTGVLLISVPDIDGLQAKLFGHQCFISMCRDTCFITSRTSLSALLQATGFCPVRRWHLEFEYDLMGWAQSALNSLLPTPNVFLHLLMGRSPRCSTAEKVVSYVAGVLIAALALPLVAAGALFSRGATLVVATHPCDLPN